MPTDDEIKNEIALLKDLKPRIRQRTGFGDDNHAAIDAQVLVLEKGMDDDAVWNEWPHDEAEDNRDEYEHIRMSAQEALMWLQGSVEKPPSDDWIELAQ